MMSTTGAVFFGILPCFLFPAKMYVLTMHNLKSNNIICKIYNINLTE